MDYRSRWQMRWDFIQSMDDFFLNCVVIFVVFWFVMALVVARAKWDLGNKIFNVIAGFGILIAVLYVIWRLFFCWIGV
jgi:hypothetical protein